MKSLRRFMILLAAFLFIANFLSTDVFAGRETKDEERSFEQRKNNALKKAEELFLSGDYKSVLQTCEDIFYLAGRPASPAGGHKLRKKNMDELYYFAGVSCLKLNNTSRARLYLTEILSKYAGSRLIPDAYLGIAESYYLEKDYPEASKYLLDYTRKYPSHESMPQAYLRLGQIAQKEGRWEEATLYFGKIRKEFPSSLEATLIPQGTDEESLFFTVQTGSFNKVENARKLKKDLERKGHSPYIEEVTSSGKTFFRVRIGKFESRKEAEQLSRKLKKQGYKTKIYP